MTMIKCINCTGADYHLALNIAILTYS